MPSLEMNPQEKKLLKNVLVMQEIYKEPAKFQPSKL